MLIPLRLSSRISRLEHPRSTAPLAHFLTSCSRRRAAPSSSNRGMSVQPSMRERQRNGLCTRLHISFQSCTAACGGDDPEELEFLDLFHSLQRLYISNKKGCLDDSPVLSGIPSTVVELHLSGFRKFTVGIFW